MAYNQTTTQILRSDRYTTSEVALLDRFQEEFAVPGDADRLALVLGISVQSATGVLSRAVKPNLDRLAFHYGFMPTDEPTGWRVMPMKEKPYDDGPRMLWTDRLIEYVRQVLSHPDLRTRIETLAWRMDTTERRLRDALRRRAIQIGSLR